MLISINKIYKAQIFVNIIQVNRYFFAVLFFIAAKSGTNPTEMSGTNSLILLAQLEPGRKRKKDAFMEVESLVYLQRKYENQHPCTTLHFFISCSDDDKPLDYISLNDREIQDYLEENNLQAEKSPSGLYYIINNEGTGEQPTSTDQVRVVYKGYFLNGNVFDQSTSEGISINLQKVIRGWTEGITYFKEGGSGMLLVPSHLGYGPEDYGSIPGGSVLIFEIDLIEVNGDAN